MITPMAQTPAPDQGPDQGRTYVDVVWQAHFWGRRAGHRERLVLTTAVRGALDGGHLALAPDTAPALDAADPVQADPVQADPVQADPVQGGTVQGGQDAPAPPATAPRSAAKGALSPARATTWGAWRAGG